MSRFYMTIGPAALEGYPEAPRATLVVHAPDERAARADAELIYRREHPEVDELRLRLTPASEQQPWPPWSSPSGPETSL
jgi:hypothetical protein